MRQFVIIAVNAFMELIRQPIFLLLTTSSAAFCVFLASVPYFGFGDDPKLAKNSVLAVTFLVGLLGAVLSASNSLAREIRTGTALAVLSKPVSRAQFLLAKYAGLAAALTVLTYVNLLACLLASRMAFDAYGDTDVASLGIWFGSLTLAFAAGGFSNFFLRRPFVSDATMALVLFTTIAFLVAAGMSKADPTSRSVTIGAFEKVDWRMIPAVTLILFALWILAGLALLCSTRLELMATLAICSAFFLVGLMSDFIYLKLGGTDAGGPWYAVTLYAILPNWQQLWMADALEAEKTIPPSYLLTAFTYAVVYVGASLAVALCLFEDRELS